VMNVIGVSQPRSIHVDIGVLRPVFCPMSVETDPGRRSYHPNLVADCPILG